MTVRDAGVCAAPAATPSTMTKRAAAIRATCALCLKKHNWGQAAGSTLGATEERAMARILYVGSAGLDKVVEHGVPIYVWGKCTCDASGTAQTYLRPTARPSPRRESETGESPPS